MKATKARTTGEHSETRPKLVPAPGTPKLAEHRRALLERVGRAREVFCVVDYDGVLAPVADTPEAALPPPGTDDLLRRLAAAPGVHVALVTGRPIADVKGILDVPGLHYIGSHGLEILLPNERSPLAEGLGIVRTVLPRIKRELERELADKAGILIEDKGASLACHYRLATPADAAMAREVTSRLATAYVRRGAPLTVENGDAVIEIRSLLANKGRTVSTLLAARAPGALPIYIGGHGTDGDAFKLLPPHAITIQVAPRGRVTARYRAKDTAEVGSFLEAILERRSRQRPTS
jgi:trehalose 6-phosphate phosphatase